MKKLFSIYLAIIASLVITTPVFAASGGITQVQNFIQNVIEVLVGLSSLVAAGFFVVGGFGYITSSGNPENLDRSKKTIFYSGIGLAICLGAFVLTNIVSQLATSAFGK